MVNWNKIYITEQSHYKYMKVTTTNVKQLLKSSVKKQNHKIVKKQNHKIKLHEYQGFTETLKNIMYFTFTLQ